MAMPMPHFWGILMWMLASADILPSSKGARCNSEDCSAFDGLGMSPTRFLFAGNPGSGKSTLLNGILGHATFKSGLSIGGVLTEQFSVAQFHRHILMDTPGLSDIRLRKQAAKEITAALRRGGDFKIVFVITLENGRPRPDDLATIRVILEAAPVIGARYGIVVNQLSHKIADRLLTNFAEINNLFAMMLETLPHPTHHFTWILHDEKLADEDNQVAELPAHFLSWLRELPSVEIWPQHVKEIKSYNFEGFREQLGRRLGDLKRRDDALQAIIAARKNEMREVDALFQRQLALAQAQAAGRANRASQLEKTTRAKR